MENNNSNNHQNETVVSIEYDDTQNSQFYSDESINASFEYKFELMNQTIIRLLRECDYISDVNKFIFLGLFRSLFGRFDHRKIVEERVTSLEFKTHFLADSNLISKEDIEILIEKAKNDDLKAVIFEVEKT